MATVYGSWVATDDWRARLDYTVSSTDTSVTFKLTGYINTIYGYTSSGKANCTLTCGSSTASGSVTGFSTNSTKQVVSKSFTVSKTSSSQSVALKAKVTVSGVSVYSGSSSTASTTYTVPAITYSTPNAPSSCSATRNSDSKATVTWTNGSTSTTRPRTRTYVERSTDGGSYTQLGYVGSSTTSYTDSSISANHRYAYRVRAYGNGGYSSYATSGYIYTTPAAPSSVTLQRSGDGTAVQVSAEVSNATYATSWDVQYSLNGGEWEDAGSVTSFPKTINPGGGSVVVRVRSVRSTLASGWTESAAITTICAPNAPSVTVGTGASVQVAGVPLAVTWVPNHTDGTAQTQAQVEYTVGSGSATTATVSGATTTYSLPSSAYLDPTTVTVRVRTHGSYDDWGEWSSYVTVSLYDEPTAAFTEPATDDTVIMALPLEVAWDASDDTGISSQTLSLVSDEGDTLWSATLSGSARSYSVTDEQYGFENLTGYLLRLTVRAGSTLTATAERTFSTDWLEPVAPAVEVDAAEGLALDVTVAQGEPDEDDEHASERPEAVSFTVSRVTSDGSWTVATGLTEGQTVRDPLPPLNVDFTYVVTAAAATGVTSRTEVTAYIDSGGEEAFNFGSGASVSLLLGYNASGSQRTSHGGSTYAFATGGDSLPLYYPTGELEGTVSRSYATADLELYRRVRELAREWPECWFRDYDGFRHMGACEFSTSIVQGSRVAREIDVSITECEFEEAW